MIKIFITATDTDAGKTYVAQSLILALIEEKLKVAAFKPISAGCQRVNTEHEAKLINEDALLLSNAANCHQSITQINPIAFEEPIAPHIAAKKQGYSIELSKLKEHYKKTLSLNCDVVLTEGAGGWRLPLGNGHFLSEFVLDTEQQVLLVVHMKLGCLNHAVLSYESIISDGLSCVGWVANCPESMDYLDENIDELKNLLPIPFLAKLVKEPDVKKAAAEFNLQPLLSCL
ncbi:MAG: dethiobiotin synthase [Colwelliaceae bacterium]|jgi:dethiobiotin synthetase|nr:dethiobiotin synthase [Colwelliaceae bacterium]